MGNGILARYKPGVSYILGICALCIKLIGPITQLFIPARDIREARLSAQQYNSVTKEVKANMDIVMASPSVVASQRMSSMSEASLRASSLRGSPVPSPGGSRQSWSRAASSRGGSFKTDAAPAAEPIAEESTRISGEA